MLLRACAPLCSGLRLLSTSSASGGAGFFDRFLGRAGVPGAPAAVTEAAVSAPAAPAGASLVVSGPESPADYTVAELRGPDGARVVPRAQASVKFVFGSTKKLNPVARQVRGKSVNEAMAQMAFSSAERARAITKALRRATQRAAMYHALPSERLMVEAAWTGRHTSSPRIRYMNKGRAGRSFKKTSQVFLRVREMSEEEAREKNRFKAADFPTAASRARLSPRGY
jgi:large subunit ribosomal protein L22